MLCPKCGREIRIIRFIEEQSALSENALSKVEISVWGKVFSKTVKNAILASIFPEKLLIFRHVIVTATKNRENPYFFSEIFFGKNP